MIRLIQLAVLGILLLLPSLDLPNKLVLYITIAAGLALPIHLSRLRLSDYTLVFLYSSIAAILVLGSLYVGQAGIWNVRSSFDFIISQCILGSATIFLLRRTEERALGHFICLLILCIGLMIVIEVLGVNWHTVLPSSKKAFADAGMSMGDDIIKYSNVSDITRYRAFFNESSSLTGACGLFTVSLWLHLRRSIGAKKTYKLFLSIGIIVGLAISTFIASKAGIVVLLAAFIGWLSDRISKYIIRPFNIAVIVVITCLASFGLANLMNSFARNSDSYLAQEWRTFSGLDNDEMTGTSSRKDYWLRALNLANQYPLGGGPVGAARYAYYSSSGHKNREMQTTDQIDPTGLKNLGANILGWCGYLGVALFLVCLYIGSKSASRAAREGPDIALFAAIAFACTVEGYYSFIAIAILYRSITGQLNSKENTNSAPASGV